MALIRYHVWWPGANDPFYLYNTSENRARANYYNVPNIGVPYLKIDGTITGSSPGAYEAQIENESYNDSPLLMQVSGSFDPDSLDGLITVTIIAEDTPAQTNLKLRFALTESGIYYNGAYGPDIHNQTFRDMIPGTAGQSITINQNDTLSYSFDFSIPSSFEIDSCEFLAFVQSDQNKYIVQGAKAWLRDFSGPTDVGDDPSVPSEFVLSQNYPNPFNAETRIEFETPGEKIKLQIYDLTGSLVRTLLDGNFNAGTHSIVWDGTNDRGDLVGSGVYFYRLIGENQTKVMRMTMLK